MEDKTWQNSIRHTLSLNKRFMKEAYNGLTRDFRHRSYWTFSNALSTSVNKKLPKSSVLVVKNHENGTYEVKNKDFNNLAVIKPGTSLLIKPPENQEISAQDHSYAESESETMEEIIIKSENDNIVENEEVVIDSDSEMEKSEVLNSDKLRMVHPYDKPSGSLKKPGLSYSLLIAEALNNSPMGKLLLQGV